MATRSTLLLVLFAVVTNAALSVETRAADAAIQAKSSGPPPVVVSEGTCLRWVWQEMSWYDDCWWQRQPYFRGLAYMVRGVRRSASLTTR